MSEEGGGVSVFVSPVREENGGRKLIQSRLHDPARSQPFMAPD